MATRTARYASVAVCCTVLGLAGCASNSTDSGTSSAPPPSDTGVAARVSTPPSTGSAISVPPTSALTTSAPTTSAAPAPCGNGQVVVDATVMSPGMGHRGVRLNFSVARDGRACTLTGYPGVDTGAGGPLLHAERTPRGYMGGLPAGDDSEPTVLLDAGHGAQAVVEGVAFDNDGKGCASYTDLRVTAPNTTDTVTVAAQIDTCHLQIHPVTAPQ
ncbi:DUF4232 domain-containing protein [Nocardia sp. NPDC058058]|uniref:DUF4232 domain-containing protein n=1 Tax=Nocardia sp. NPDC058058 TaxID=3346317 RepID=UPI0036DF03FB